LRHAAALAVAFAAALATASAARAEDPPLAGYSNGGFFIHDPHDWFVLFPSGRLQVDWINFLNRGDAPAGVTPNEFRDNRPDNTLDVRRARAEIMGTIFKHFDFHFAGEWASVPGVGHIGTVADAYVIVNYTRYCQLQLGQFDIPFSLENRTWDNYQDFMERSVTGRLVVGPIGKDAGGMVFGWLPKNVAYYSIGLFNGDGNNIKNQDDYLMVAMRGFVAPLAPWAAGRAWMQQLWIGASFWWQTAKNLGAVAAPNANDLTGPAQNDLPTITTQGGQFFFNGNYDNGLAHSHLAPNGTIYKWALEANIPAGRMGLRFELMHDSIDLMQYNTSFDSSTLFVRSTSPGARLDGLGYYIEAYAWILGDIDFLEPPGLEAMPRLRPYTQTSAPRWGLMIAAKYEHLGLDVIGLPATTARDPAEGHYQLDTFELGINAWATRHARLTTNYVINYFDGDSTRIRRNFFYQRVEHELLFRLGVTL